MKLFDYQEIGVSKIAHSVSQHRKSIFQLPTGGGKTVVFAAISHRFISKNPLSVLIVVHREELLNQALGALMKWYGIRGQPVVAGMRKVPPARVYVAMVDSLERRMHLLMDLGLIIIDEAHRGEFKKIHKHFEKQFIIGVTATPVAASKKDPLLNYYNSIVTGPTVLDLISLGSLCQNMTYSISGIKRTQFSPTGVELGPLNS